MKVRRPAAKTLVRAGATIVALAGLAHGASAQLPADASWRTISSAHFRVTYETDLEPLARHAAASAERARAALITLLADAPAGKVDIVLADHTDQSNGSATPFPSNRIVIYAKPPVDLLELQYTRDWVELVVAHELAHIFHLDATSGLGGLIRTVFGRVPLPWPAFPAVGVPLWSIEGLAVGVESALTGYGRVHGSYNEMIVRTAALAGRLDEYDRLGSSSARWPGAARVYIYGSLFMDYLARRYGPDAAGRVVRSTAGAVIPPPLWFGRVGTDALGVTFRRAYRDWEREVTARSDSLARVLRAEGLTSGTVLTTHGAIASYPRFSHDSRSIAYAAHDWRAPPELRVIDAATGAELWSERVNQPAPAAWLAQDRLAISQIDLVDRFRAFADLHIIVDDDGDRDDHGGNDDDDRDDRQITYGQRLQDVDVSRGGRIVAVQNEAGTNRLVLVHPMSGQIRPVTAYDAGTHWSLPRFAPAGDRIAAARWSTGGSYQIVVLDTAGTTELVVTDARGINAAPAWSPDGRWIIFSSDRSGISNLYAADVDRIVRDSTAALGMRSTLHQVTSVLTGAFQPDVSPDGRWIAYSAYTDAGFRIERMRFDTAQWRTPATHTTLSTLSSRAQYATATNALLDSALSAFRTADTLASEPRAYSPLRSLRPHFWLPTITSGSVEDATFVGFRTSGKDLVDRHAWQASLSIEPRGRTQGRFSYAFRGMPTIAALGMHPVVSMVAAREWDTYLPRTTPGGAYANEREDVIALSLDLTHARWRSSSGIGVAAESVRRSRYLHDSPAGSLIDPIDNMWGLRASAFTARYVTPVLAISRENGFTFQAAARQRWERDVVTADTDDGPVTFDAAYRELTSWNTAYLALPLPGFARHVLAARFSGLLRDGPGAPFSRLGGAGGSGFTLPGIVNDIGGSSILLPVRGFLRGARLGSNAWSASLEYRFPIALIDTPLRPFFFDRVSAAVFVDAGHAWCGSELATRFDACTSTSGAHMSLLSAGAETTALIGFLGIHVPLRFGAGVPLHGADDASPRFYILSGPSF